MRLLLVLLLAVQAQAAPRSGPPVACYISDASGNALSSTAGALNVSGAGGGGGGTQYAQGTTQATPTGTVAMGKDPSNVLKALSFDASGNVNMNLAAGSISGGNAAASATGSAVPAQADYIGWNSGGSLVGASPSNPVPVAQQGAISASVSNFPANQTVSGTVGVSNAFMLDATATGGAAKSIVRGGAKGTSAAADVTSTATDANHQALDTNVNNFPANQTVSWSGQSVSISGTPAVTISSGTVTGNDGGTKITAATMPSGGVGLTGWLSGILQQLVNGISVTVQNATLAVTESGNFIVQPGNTANTTPWLEKLHDGTNPLLFTTKGVQATNVLPTQDFKDSGRSARTFTLDGFAIAATTETLHTMSYSTDNAALTTGTSYSVTAGKRLRLQQLVGTLHTITGNTTAITCIIRIRANAAGAAIVSSPVQYVMALPGIAAANQSAGSVPTQFPDGWEFAASTGIGVTSTCPGFVATTAAPKLNISITGYEY